MSIEFRCNQCQQLLKTPDDTGGKQSRCPHCGHIQLIPAAAGEVVPPGRQAGSPFGFQDAGENPFGDLPQSADGKQDAYQNPYASPTASAVRVPPTPAEVRAKLQTPAIFSISWATLGVMYAATGLVWFCTEVIREGWTDNTVSGFFGAAVFFVSPGLILAGSIQMLRLKLYGLAVAGAIMAMVPCTPCWCLELPFGIWALVLLVDVDIRSSFT